MCNRPVYDYIPDPKSKMNPKRNPTLTIGLTHTLSVTLNSNPYAYTYHKPSHTSTADFIDYG